MVITRMMVTIEEAERIIKESSGKSEAVEKLHQLKKRRVKPPAPEGGISFMDASRKYKIPPATLSDWLKNNLIELLKSDGKFKFLKESDVKERAGLERRAGRPKINAR